MTTLPKPYYDDGKGIVIYHGDCREILPLLPKAAAIVSDPPYGMKWDGRVTRGRNGTGAVGPTRHFGATIHGDDKPFDPTFMTTYSQVVIWGMNHFPQHLSRGTVLVWLKRYDDGFGSFLSDAELAWCNRGCGVYCKRDVSLQGESSTRLHPSQKPVEVMKWCLSFTDSMFVIDPFMGSGTTLVAAKQLGRRAIGIEIEERYCAIAAERLRQEVFDFAPPEPQAEQETLFGDVA